MFSICLNNIFLRILFCIIVSNLAYGKTVSIHGTIIDEEGKPLKKTSISLRSLKDQLLLEAVTNRKGKFSIKNIKPDFYYLVIENELKTSKRIKINPRKTRNKDLILRLELNNNEQLIECFLFDNKNPTEFDPILKIRDFKEVITAGNIELSWKDIKQVKEYVLYEDNIEIYRGDKSRFEKAVFPGREFCYKIQAFGDFDLKGVFSEIKCLSTPTYPPTNISVEVFKNSFNLKWKEVEGAKSYVIYQNQKKYISVNEPNYLIENLEFNKDYFYTIRAIDNLNINSESSIEVKYTTHDYVDAPLLSSMKSNSNIMLIWNEVNFAKSYKIYRDDKLIDTSDVSSFPDDMLPGEEYCYEVSCIDQYGIESYLSNKHCTKVNLEVPKKVTADSDVESMHLNWDSVKGAISYQIYEKINSDSLILKGKVKKNQFTIESLSYASDHCYVITAIDGDGDETDFSIPACNVSFDPPDFKIHKMTLIEPSGNSILDAEESGKIQIALFNKGQSPAHRIIASILLESLEKNIILGDPVMVDTLEAGRIKFIEFDIKALLAVKSGDNKIELLLSSKEGIRLKDPYFFNIETKSMIPPKVIIADFSISNDFGTNYIPKHEQVNLTLRIQNVGEGLTEFVNIIIKENRSYETPNFNGIITLSKLNPGEFLDIEVPILNKQNNFSVDIDITDYLGLTTSKRIDLETMRKYRSPYELTAQSIGTEEVEYYPDELGEVDVDRRIPLGRKNPNAIAVILATEFYNDNNFVPIDYVTRDKTVIRTYFKESFGLSDFQLLPSKTWQMDGGPTGNDLINIFDPHQGDLRKRIITAEKYSGIKEVDIYLYYRGYGEWINGKPFLIPKDAKLNRNVSKYSLEQLMKNISILSVMKNIKTITIFLDISYINPKVSNDLIWDFQQLSDKICILSASSNGQTSQIYYDKKHSIFTYTLLKGLSGNADNGDNVIELGELAEYLYQKVPEYSSIINGGFDQNPSFNGSDLKRVILDLR
tara:strand:- start:2312 stop:5284 length:2973 start_codon:yes stop_codon:yes gene_type:complete